MRTITLPEKIEIKDLKGNRYQVVIGPCYPGFGVNLGNSLRRVLLSSLKGGAVTSFKVEGAQHEFDSVDYIKEDLIEIMLNLKKLRVKVHTDEPVKLTIEAKGEKVVTAADISKNSDVDVINKDLVIATLTDKQAKLSMEIIVENGIGYQTVEQRADANKLEIGNIAIDSSFSPVINVGHEIENVRVGEMTNYEKLILDILTDGTIDAQTAISQAASVLRDHYSALISEEAAMPAAETEEAPVKKTRKSTKKAKTEDKKEK